MKRTATFQYWQIIKEMIQNKTSDIRRIVDFNDISFQQDIQYLHSFQQKDGHGIAFETIYLYFFFLT